LDCLEHLDQVDAHLLGQRAVDQLVDAPKQMVGFSGKNVLPFSGLGRSWIILGRLAMRIGPNCRPAE
jgi:hypothetical protein